MGGDELKKARVAAGLTQEQLAFKTGLHRTYISLLERNKNSLTIPTLFKVCKVLGIRPSTLVSRIKKRRGR